MKYSSVPDSKLYGMIWSPRGYGLRVLQQDAAQIAPVLIGKTFIVGDRYVVSGVPHDVTPEQLFEALAACDVPWEEITTAQNIAQRKKGGSCCWTIKATRPPPTNIFFLDECVISIDKEMENMKIQEKAQPKVSTMCMEQTDSLPNSR